MATCCDASIRCCDAGVDDDDVVDFFRCLWESSASGVGGRNRFIFLIFWCKKLKVDFKIRE